MSPVSVGVVDDRERGVGVGVRRLLGRVAEQEADGDDDRRSPGRRTTGCWWRSRSRPSTRGRSASTPSWAAASWTPLQAFWLKPLSSTPPTSVTSQALIIAAAGSEAACLGRRRLGCGSGAAGRGGRAATRAESLLELQPASAIAETATMAAAILRLVFNSSPCSVAGRRHGARTCAHPNHPLEADARGVGAASRSLQRVHIRRCDGRHGSDAMRSSSMVTKRSRSMSRPTRALAGRPVTDHRSATVRPDAQGRLAFRSEHSWAARSRGSDR